MFFWITLPVVLCILTFFWYKSGFPIEFSKETIRQAMTGIREEMLFTVFLTKLLFQILITYFKMKQIWIIGISVFVSALIFAFLHIGKWDFIHFIKNIPVFFMYRIFYFLTGSFIVGLVFHNISNNQFLALPIVIGFYMIVICLDWIMKKIKN